MKHNLHLFALLVALVSLPQVVLADELTVNDGTTTNVNIPVMSSMADQYTHQQFIIPASALSQIASGSTITAIRFYSADASQSWGKASWAVSLGETTQTDLSLAYVSVSHVAYAGAVSVSNSEMQVNFATPYIYNGGNLVVDFSETITGSYGRCSFYGVSTSSYLSRYGNSASSAAAVGGYGYSGFVPKTTLEYETGGFAECAKVGKPVVSGVTDNQARITWTKGGRETQWLVKIGDADYVTVSDTSYQFTNLMANSLYSYEVCALCSKSDTAEAQKGSFRTACGVIDLALGSYHCGFETAEGYSGSAVSACAVSDYIGSASENEKWTVRVGASEAVSGSQSLYLPGYYGQFSSQSFFAFPEVRVPTGKEYELLLWVRGGDYGYAGDSLVVYTNTQPNMTGATCIGRIDHPSNRYTQYAFDMPAGQYYVILAGYTGYMSYYGNYHSGTIMMDDAVMREKPSCRPSKNLHFVGSDLTSATFAWTAANGETEWQLQYRNAASAAFQTVRLSDSTFTLSGLTTGTAYGYDFVLHSVCDGALSVDSAKYSFAFHTACEQVVADTVRFDAEIGELTPCYETYFSRGNLSLWDIDAFNGAHSGFRSFRLYGYEYSNSAAVLVLPAFSLGEDQQLSFWAREDTHNAADSLIVRIAVEGDTTELYRIATMTEEWTVYRVDLSAYRGENARILLEGFGYNSLYVDDVEIAPRPSCPAVSVLKYAGLGASDGGETYEAAFAWRAGGEETEWRCTYRLKADTAGAGFSDWTTDVVDTLVFAVTDLEPSIPYVVELKVKAVCEEEVDESEEVAGSFRFRTPCSAQEGIGYVEDFETVENGMLPDCWTAVQPFCRYGNTWPYVKANTDWDSCSYSGNNSLYFFNGSDAQTGYSVVALPAFNEDINNLRLKFHYKNSSKGTGLGYFVVGTMSSLTDAGTFHPYQSLACDTAYTLASVDFVGIPATDGYIAIKYTSGNGYAAYIDSVAIEGQSACVPVRNLRVDSIGTTAARIAWTPGKSEAEWSVVIKEGEKVLVSDTIQEPFVLLDNLQLATWYSWDVLVKAMCDGIESDDFLPEATLSFMTECESISTLPWSEDFEDAVSGEMPTCWTRYDKEGHTKVYEYYAYAHAGDKFIRATGGSSYYGDTYIVLPKLESEARATTLQFYYMQGSVGGQYASVQVGVMSDATDTTSYRPVATLAQKDSYALETVELSTAPAGCHYIALRVLGNANSYTLYYFDDFTVRVSTETPTACEGVATEVKAVKMVRDSRVYILREGVLYDVTGRRVE